MCGNNVRYWRGTVGLAEWIIDDSSQFFVELIQQRHRVRIDAERRRKIKGSKMERNLIQPKRWKIFFSHQKWKSNFVSMMSREQCRLLNDSLLACY